MVPPVADRYACSSPLPPASAAGFVHAATMFASGTLPNSVLAGGGIVERNDAYVMTHPVWVAEWQSGTCWNEPPTSLPLGTESVVPSRMAETIRQADPKRENCCLTTFFSAGSTFMSLFGVGSVETVG